MIVIFDSVFDQSECNDLINLYAKYEQNSHEWRGTKPLDLSFAPESNGYLLKILKKVNSVFTANYDWGEIVKWDTGTYQPYHLDSTSDKTILTSIVYLNENFDGGYTIFNDGTKVKPKIGRCLIFNGQNYIHGVSEVTQGTRWTLPIWYK